MLPHALSRLPLPHLIPSPASPSSPLLPTGIIYEDLNDRDKEKIFAFATDAANHIVESYVPIIKKHKNDPYSPRQKEWQQIRRGR